MGSTIKYLESLGQNASIKQFNSMEEMLEKKGISKDMIADIVVSTDQVCGLFTHNDQVCGLFTGE